MAWYYPTVLSQKNQTHEPHLSHRLNNCTCTTGATGLDFHTRGLIKVFPGDIRHHQSDQVGGTDVGDIKKAWASYGQVLTIRSSAWSVVLQSLAEFRCVLLPVDSGYLSSNCCSKSQDVAHSILLHPEHRTYAGKVQQRVMDPWCNPPKWVWVDRAVLQNAHAHLPWTIGVTRARKP